MDSGTDENPRGLDLSNFWRERGLCERFVSFIVQSILKEKMVYIYQITIDIKKGILLAL